MNISTATSDKLLKAIKALKNHHLQLRNNNITEGEKPRRRSEEEMNNLKNLS